MTIPSDAAKQLDLQSRVAAWFRDNTAKPGEDRSLRDSLVIYGPTLAFFLLVTFRTPALVRDSDTYWHIVAGTWMLDHRTIPRTDFFSYTFAGHSWVTHEWLGEVLLAFVFRHLGWPGLDLLIGIAAGITAYLLARALLRTLQPIPAVLIQQIAMLGIIPNLLGRPFVFMLPLLAVWTAGILAAREERRAPRWWMLGLVLVWANLHASVVLAPALVGFFGLEAAWEARHDWLRALLPWLAFGVAATLVSLMTPNGIDVLVTPFKMAMSKAMTHIVEWQSSVFVGVSPLEIAILSMLLLFAVKPVRIPPPRLLLLLVLLHETLQHRRYEYILAIVGSLILAKPIADAFRTDGETTAPRPPAFATAIAAIAVVTIAALRLAIPADPGSSAIAPIAAVAHVPKEVAQQHVLNDYNQGGYLIFNHIPTFIDDRTDFYGDAFVENDLAMEQPDTSRLKAILARYRIVWTIFPSDAPVNQILDLLPGWRVLYKDQYAVVHVRAGMQK